VSEPRLIVALDFPGAGPALDLAGRLDPAACAVKVGKELFTRAGPEVVRRLHALGFRVFLDLKFHDIPNTVAGACRAAGDLGVWMLDVHALGGRAMLEAARAACAEYAPRPLLIAVTVLTSLAPADMAPLGFQGTPADNAERLALLARDCALDGVVCSAQEIGRLRRVTDPGFRLVTPGIRPAGSASGDQKRVMTPAAALAAGASHLVIGRPITAAPDPVAALRAIEEEIAPYGGG